MKGREKKAIWGHWGHGTVSKNTEEQSSAKGKHETKQRTWTVNHAFQ